MERVRLIRGGVQGTQHAFIVRVWDEQVDDQGYIVIWRGSIEHVWSRSRLHFNDFDQMVRFIRKEARIQKERRFRGGDCG